MSVFSRTAPGISNYSKFYGVDFVVYTEGKITNSEYRDDVRYYEAVLEEASHGKIPKVKCVGNKETAFDYARKIRDGEVHDGIVIVDKDLDDILNSSIDVYPVIRTLGYSWENELWSLNTILHVVSQITCVDEKAILEVQKSIPRLTKKMKYLSSLDAVSQINGIALLDKRKALCGVSFSFSTLSMNEIRRLRNKFNGTISILCPVSQEIFNKCQVADSFEIIQGHFWNNVVIRVIAGIYKKTTKDSIPSNALIQKLAFSYLKDNVVSAVGECVINKYRNDLVRFGIS